MSRDEKQCERCWGGGCLSRRICDDDSYYGTRDVLVECPDCKGRGAVPVAATPDEAGKGRR